jgi:hypothetical protein
LFHQVIADCRFAVGAEEEDFLHRAIPGHFESAKLGVARPVHWWVGRPDHVEEVLCTAGFLPDHRRSKGKGQRRVVALQG